MMIAPLTTAAKQYVYSKYSLDENPRKLANKLSAFYAAKQETLVISHKKWWKGEMLLLVGKISESSIRQKNLYPPLYYAAVCKGYDQILLVDQKEALNMSPGVFTVCQHILLRATWNKMWPHLKASWGDSKRYS